MNKPFTQHRLPLFLLLAISLLTACGKSEDSTSLVNDAKVKLAAGDRNAAMIQLKNAVTHDEKNAEARFELGKLYLEQNNLEGAEKELRHAREAGYPTSTVNPLIARALLGQREFQRVLDEVPAPATNEVNAATVQSLRATAELGLGNKEEARKTLQAARTASPDTLEIHLALAQLALADRDLPKALAALDQALVIDPSHRDSLLLKGDLLRATGKTTEAADTYRRAVQADPRHTNARLALAGIAITENKLDDARKEVDAALKISPKDLLARYTEALIDFKEKKNERARDNLAAVLKAAPAYVPALLLGGSIEYALGNLQTAESHLNKVVQAAPKNILALRLLAATQLRLGRTDDALRTLSPALKANTQDAGILVVAGEIALARKDYAGASAYFEQAVQRNPDSAVIRTELGISRLAQGDRRAMADLQAAAGMEGAGTRADNFIILSHLGKKDFDAALQSIAALEKKQAATPLTWNYRGAAYLGKNDTTRARDSFSQALKLDPVFFPAAANLAQLDIKDNNPVAARQHFEKILKTDARHLNAMLALADLAKFNNDDKAHLSWLEKAAAADPQSIQPPLALGRYHLAKGDKNKALAAARAAVSVQPDNPAAIELLGASQLAIGDTTNAMASYRKLVDKIPGQAAVWVKLASIQVISKDFNGARKSLQAAQQTQPGMLEAQLMLGNIEIKDGKLDEAQKIAKQIQQGKPNNAAGFILEGDVAFARKDFQAALIAFERAHKLQPSSTMLIRQLHALKASQRLDEGEKRLAAWLDTHATDTVARAALAESLMSRGQYKAAAAHYLVLNRNHPNNLVFLNNLAWSLFESQDSRALAFAEQALKLKPDNPAVMDTVGWILVQQKQTERGIKLLQQAQAKAPDAAEIQYHLAFAFAQSGDRMRARDALERLLASGLAFPQEKEARALLKSLQGKSARS